MLWIVFLAQWLYCAIALPIPAIGVGVTDVAQGKNVPMWQNNTEWERPNRTEGDPLLTKLEKDDVPIWRGDAGENHSNEEVVATFPWSGEKSILNELIQVTGCSASPMCMVEEWVVGYTARNFNAVIKHSASFLQFNDDTCIRIILSAICQGSPYGCAYTPDWMARLQKESDEQAKELALASTARVEIGERMVRQSDLISGLIGNVRSIVSYISTKRIEDQVASNTMGSGRHAIERINGIVDRFTQTADSLVARYIAMSGATHPYTVHLGGREMLSIIDSLSSPTWSSTMVSFFDHDAFLNRTAQQVDAIHIMTINPYRCLCTLGNRSHCVESVDGNLEMEYWYKIVEDGIDRTGCVAVGGTLPNGSIVMPSTVSYVVGAGKLEPHKVTDIATWDLVSKPGVMMSSTEVAEASRAIGSGNYKGNVVWWSPIDVNIDPLPFYRHEKFRLPPCTWGWDEKGRPSPTCIFPILKQLKRAMGYLVDDIGNAWEMGALNACEDPFRSNPSIGSYGITPQKFMVSGVLEDVSSLAKRLDVESTGVDVLHKEVKTADDFLSKSIRQNGFAMAAMERGTNNSLGLISKEIDSIAAQNVELSESIKSATDAERNNSMRLHAIADAQALRTKEEKRIASRLDRMNASIRSPPSMIPVFAWCGVMSAGLIALAAFVYVENLKRQVMDNQDRGGYDAVDKGKQSHDADSGHTCHLPLWIRISGYVTMINLASYVAAGVAIAVMVIPYVRKFKVLSEDVEELLSAAGFI